MARNIGVSFNGKRIVKPGAHSRIIASGIGAVGSNSEKKIVFLGTAESGKPGVLHNFSGFSEARDVLRGGDLLTAGELAWTPSNDGRGAGEIGFIRVEDATQATLTKTGLKVTSKLYGEQANKTQIKLEDGTLTGSKRLTAYFWEDNIREIYDNLGPVFNIRYEGADVFAAMTITADAGGKASKFIVKTGADSGSATELLSYNIGDQGEFKDINKLVNELNERPDFSVTSTTAGNKNLGTAVLDIVADKPIKTTHTVTALAGDILSQLELSQIVDVEITGAIPANFEFEYLSGGSSDAAPASWAEKLDLVVGEGAYILVPLTPDEAIHAEVARFVEQQSSNEQSEMRAFYGGGLAEDIDRVINRAVTLNSPRATVCYPAITRETFEQGVETLPAYFTAAIVAGRVAGVPIGEPVTFDYLSLIGLERVLSSKEIDKLIESGVTPIEYVRSRNRRGFRIAQCVTSYQEDNNPAYRENSMNEIMDFLNVELREHLESRFIGTKATALTTALIKNEVQSFLDQKVRDEWLTEYDPTSVVVQDGDVFQVAYSAMPVYSINHILITGTFYRSQLTAA